MKCHEIACKSPHTITVGTLPNLNSRLLSDLCKNYKKQYPDVIFLFKQQTFSNYFQAFAAGDFDITADYMFNFVNNHFDNPAIGIIPCKPFQLDICVPEYDPLACVKSVSFKDMRGRKLMIHTRGISRSDDTLRDYVETHEPSIEIIDFPYYSQDLFLKAELDKAILLSVREYSFDILNFRHIPFNCVFPVERGILYHKQCNAEVKNFIALTRQFLQEKNL